MVGEGALDAFTMQPVTSQATINNFFNPETHQKRSAPSASTESDKPLGYPADAHIPFINSLFIYINDPNF